MAHLHDKIDFTVDIFIVHQNKVLLRLHEKYHMWLAVGGHIELDEDPNQAAVREALEETGLTITLESFGGAPARNEADYKTLIPSRYLNRHRISPTHEHISFIYFSSTKNDKINPSAGEDKNVQFEWLTKKEVESKTDVLPDIKFYALEALKAFET